MPLDDLSPEWKYSFGGHETFSLRYGWLKKAADFVSRDELIFSRDNALVSLGVGKNMVRAIRHWAVASGILKEQTVPGSGTRGGLQVSDLGKALLLDQGWDPFFEDPASLWLIHWSLVSNLTRATVWYLSFTVYQETEFDKGGLVRFLKSRLKRVPVRVLDSVLEREVDCLARTYAVVSRGRKQDSDQADCPLVDLSLLQTVDETGKTRFNIGPKDSLPAAVLGYALAEYFAHRGGSQRTFTVDECLYGPGSPGQAFKLDEATFLDYLDQLESLTNSAMKVSESAGNAQVFLQESVSKLEVLGAYYDQKRHR